MLLCNKTKVAALKPLTIPRLELEAAVILAKLIKAVREARSLATIQYQCLTDAGIVLTRLSQHASRWKPFIANRISEIHSLLPESQWRYVPTDANPADILSRGSSVCELQTSCLCCHRPPLLTKSAKQWPENLITCPSSYDLEEKCQMYANQSITLTFYSLRELIERILTWKKLVRIIATIWKYIQILQAKVNHLSLKSKALDSADIEFAELCILKSI